MPKQRQLARRHLSYPFDPVHFTVLCVVPQLSHVSFGAGLIDRAFDLDGAHPALDLGPDKVDMQQPVVEPRPADLDPFRQHEGALELARGDAAMQINPLGIVGLLAADDELIILDGDAEIAHRKSGDGEGDAQRIFAELLDVVGRIPVARDLADAVERPLEMVETEQQRRVEQRQSRHWFFSSSVSEKPPPGPYSAPSRGSPIQPAYLGLSKPTIKQAPPRPTRGLSHAHDLSRALSLQARHANIGALDLFADERVQCPKRSRVGASSWHSSAAPV